MTHLSVSRAIGLLLVLAGLFGLVFGGFPSTKEAPGLTMRASHADVNERTSVPVPAVVSAAAVLGGTLIMLFGGGRRIGT